MAEKRGSGRNGKNTGTQKQRGNGSRSSSGTQQSLRSRITGEADLQKADKLLKSMLRREKPVTEDNFNKIRNIIRAQKTKANRLFWTSTVLAILLILALLAGMVSTPRPAMPKPTTPITTATPREITHQIEPTRRETASSFSSRAAMKCSRMWGMPK